jgi:hypothetical protein
LISLLLKTCLSPRHNPSRSLLGLSPPRSLQGLSFIGCKTQISHKKTSKTSLKHPLCQSARHTVPESPAHCARVPDTQCQSPRHTVPECPTLDFYYCFESQAHCARVPDTQCQSARHTVPESPTHVKNPKHVIKLYVIPNIYLMCCKSTPNLAKNNHIHTTDKPHYSIVSRLYSHCLVSIKAHDDCKVFYYYCLP